MDEYSKNEIERIENEISAINIRMGTTPEMLLNKMQKKKSGKFIKYTLIVLVVFYLYRMCNGY